MIKTPVELGHRLNCIIDADGNVIAYDVDYKGGGQEIVKRINLHGELVKSLREMVEIVVANFCSNQEIKQKYRSAFNLINDLEKCK